MEKTYNSNPGDLSGSTGTTAGYGSVGPGGMSQTGSTVDQAKDKAHEAAEQGRRKASEMMGQARQQIKSTADSQIDRAAETLGSTAEALRQASDQMRQQEHDRIAKFADGAAGLVDDVTTYLRDHDIDQIMGDVENAARRNPAAFLGTAFALGFMATRFLKASGTSGYSGGQGGYQGGYQGSGSYGYGGYGYGSMAGRADAVPSEYGSGYAAVGTASGAVTAYPPTVDATNTTGETLEMDETEEVTGTYRR